MPNTVTLNEIRSAIRKLRRVSLTYEREKLVADFYLLGHARKTRAYVVIAWCIEPVKEWRTLRYAMMKDLESVGSFEGLRNDFNPSPPGLGGVDTIAYHPPKRGAS